LINKLLAETLLKHKNEQSDLNAIAKLV